MAFLYIISGRFSSDDAMSIRVMNFCEILKETGKEVIVISLDDVEPFKVYVHRGVKYISLRSLSKSFFSKVLNYLLFKRRLIKVLKSIGRSGIEGLFFYDIPANAIFFLKKYVKRNKIKIYHDSVEWYSPQQFKWGRFSLAYNMKNLLNSYLLDKQINVIAISKYLHNYFNLKGIPTIRIPVVFDIYKITCKKSIPSNKLTLLYAGSPGKKDYIKEMVEGIAILKSEELQLIELILIGINKKQLIELSGVSESVITKCGDSLIIKGRITRDEVLKELEFANFTVLLRSPKLRYAKAGFPTKVVESLASGTPVICNLTSDLNDYLINEKNSLIVKECTAKSFAKTLRKALLLSFNERKILCNNARETAELNFDYKIFKKQLNSFLCEN